MKRRTDMVRRPALETELPGEPILGTPLVEIFGNCRVLIENHKGVIGYSACEICVRTGFGTYSVCGDKLEIASMTKHQLVIVGTIESVSLTKGR